MGNFIDSKYIIWERVHLDEHADMQAIKEALEGGMTLDDLIGDAGFQEAELLFETMEGIPSTANPGEATVEVYENSKLIYTNEQLSSGSES